MRWYTNRFKAELFLVDKHYASNTPSNKLTLSWWGGLYIKKFHPSASTRRAQLSVKVTSVRSSDLLNSIKYSWKITAAVIIIALNLLHLLEQRKQIWRETKLVTKNPLSYINIHDTFGVEFYIFCFMFSSCDYAASFNRKDKVKSLKVLEENESVQHVFFSKLNELDVITEEDIWVVEGFECATYRKKQTRSVNEWPLQLFLTKKRQAKKLFGWQSEETGFCHFTMMFQSALEKNEEVKLYSKILEKLFKC